MTEIEAYRAMETSEGYKQLRSIIEDAMTLADRAEEFARKHRIGCRCGLCRWLTGGRPGAFPGEKIAILEDLKALAWSSRNAVIPADSMIPKEYAHVEA